LLQSPQAFAWALYQYPSAPTYTKGRIGMLGDAAHAMFPFEGQGAGQAIEDSLVLGEIFGHAMKKLFENTSAPDSMETRTYLEAALIAYDLVRRPRAERAQKSTHDAGRMYTMLDNKDDLVLMAEMSSTRYDWLWNVDLDEQIENAVAIFKETLLKKGIN
jgi:salicylate hydroxylase